MNHERNIRSLYFLHHSGRERAITREDFLQEYSCVLDGIGDRTLRNIYSRLPILTCAAGGYYPLRGAEVVAMLRDLEKRREALKLRKIRIFLAHKRLLGDAGDALQQGPWP